jgi:hypothetical protein
VVVVGVADGVGVGVTVPRSAGFTTSVKVFWTWPRALVAEMSTNVLSASPTC